MKTACSFAGKPLLWVVPITLAARYRKSAEFAEGCDRLSALDFAKTGTFANIEQGIIATSWPRAFGNDSVRV